MNEKMIFSRIDRNSKLTVLTEPEMIDFLQNDKFNILQVCDLLGSRPINVLRYLIEYTEKENFCKLKEVKDEQTAID